MAIKTLTLTIAEPWFSMIRDGKKKEEYREIKDHYFHLLYNYAEMQKFFACLEKKEKKFTGCEFRRYWKLLNKVKR